MRRLRENDFKFYYNNDEDDILNDFYIPALRASKLYRRAVGFFSSSSLMIISKGLEEFLNNNGKMQLIISPNLSKEDIEAISNGYKLREDIIEEYLNLTIDFSDIYKDQYNLLAWLIYENRLEIKVVVRKDLSNYGLFHDKFGIISDDYDTIVFHGSMNESETAIVDNYESFEVFVSWNNDDLKRVRRIEKVYDNIWFNNSSKWISYDFPESIKKRIIEFKSVKRPTIKKNKDFFIPENIKLREYQKNAINKWIQNDCIGILEMATGTGKTFTAISAMIRLVLHLNSKKVACGIVIVLPYKSLLEQWERELGQFNVNTLNCYENKNLWRSKFKNLILDFNRGFEKNFVVLTTNTTFISKEFQEILELIKLNYIFCVDEMHHLVGEKISKKLPINADFRLGLTATLPKNNGGNWSKVESYFNNNVIFKYSLEEAIKNNYLTNYFYYPILVELTDEEKLEYFELSRKISKIYMLDKES